MIPALAAAAVLWEAVKGYIPDPNERAKAAQDIMAKSHELTLEQIRTNQQEAQHSSLFVAGWRPFIGWTGGVALAYAWVARDILVWISNILGVAAPPALDVNAIISLVMALLGIGGYRTFEKVKGVPPSMPGKQKQISGGDKAGDKNLFLD